MAFAGTIELDEEIANGAVGTIKPLTDLGVGAALWEATAGSWSMIDCRLHRRLRAWPRAVRAGQVRRPDPQEAMPACR